jgi:hypothetical protein
MNRHADTSRRGPGCVNNRAVAPALRIIVAHIARKAHVCRGLLLRTRVLMTLLVVTSLASIFASWLLFGFSTVVSKRGPLLVEPKYKKAPLYDCEQYGLVQVRMRPKAPSRPRLWLREGDLLLIDGTDVLVDDDTKWAVGEAVSPLFGGVRFELAGLKCVPRSDVVPVSLDQLGVSHEDRRGNTVELFELFPQGESILLTQYGPDGSEILSIVRADNREGFPDIRFSLYQIGANKEVHWVAVRPLYSLLFMFSGLCFDSSARAAGRVPDILAFQPPVGLVCWRWHEGTLRPGVPTFSQALLLMGLAARGYILWIGALLFVVAMRVAGVHLVMARDRSRQVLGVTAGLLQLTIWLPTLASFILLPVGVLALVSAGVRARLTKFNWTNVLIAVALSCLFAGIWIAFALQVDNWLGPRGLFPP